MSGPCGLLAVVVARRGRTATLCRVLHRPRYRHRSDVPIEFGDCMALGINTGNRVRCRVFRLDTRHLTKRPERLSADLLARIRIAIEKEKAATRWERAERRSGGVSRVYG